jgi:hypothetical protein
VAHRIHGWDGFSQIQIYYWLENPYAEILLDTHRLMLLCSIGIVED